MRIKGGRVLVAAMALVAASGATARSPLLPPEGFAPAGPGRADARCAAFGPEFRSLAGSDTCVRLGGSLRVETGINTSGRSFTPASR